MSELVSKLVSEPGIALPDQAVRQLILENLQDRFGNQKVLVLIPDHTRSLPLPMLFRVLVEALSGTAQLDFMVALGTHPALNEAHLLDLVGITADEKVREFSHVRILNHNWDDDSHLVSLGEIDRDQMRSLAGNNWHSSLPEKVNIRINKAILEYDQIIILGPTFPHEVVGFSGGYKYLFPGISGPDMINATHWLGALASVVNTIGIKDTPVRAMINAAAEHVNVPVTLIALTVQGTDLSAICVGDPIRTWSQAADLSSERHIRWFEKPFKKVLSWAPAMYDELWTAAKAMYKLEPVVEEGGELIIYAPHLKEVSLVHGRYIYEIGYHVLPYFLEDFERFKHVPLGVLAHSTHVRGSGVMVDGVEHANVRVSLASQISPEDCARLNLGYVDPASIVVEDWMGREDEGILYVPKAGEILHRLRG